MTTLPLFRAHSSRHSAPRRPGRLALWLAGLLHWLRTGEFRRAAPAPRDEQTAAWVDAHQLPEKPSDEGNAPAGPVGDDPQRCRHCGGEIAPCLGGAMPVCKGWIHVAYAERHPVGAHYCEARSINPYAEPPAGWDEISAGMEKPSDEGIAAVPMDCHPEVKPFTGWQVPDNWRPPGGRGLMFARPGKQPWKTGQQPAIPVELEEPAPSDPGDGLGPLAPIARPWTADQVVYNQASQITVDPDLAKVMMP